MSVPAKLKIGADFNVSHEFLDEANAPVSLVGWTSEADLKTVAGGTVIASFTFDATEEASGILILKLADTVTATLAVGVKLLYDVKLTDGSGNIYYTDNLSILPVERITD